MRIWESIFTISLLQGVIVGIIVLLVGRIGLVLWSAIKVGKKNQKYILNCETANKEVLFLLRQDISQGNLPSPTVAQMLIKSTARKYSVEIRDMWDTCMFVEELTREVMESVFTSFESKVELCDKFEKYIDAEHDRMNSLIESKHKIIEGIHLSKTPVDIAFQSAVVMLSFVNIFLLERYGIKDTEPLFLCSIAIVVISYMGFIRKDAKEIEHYLEALAERDDFASPWIRILHKVFKRIRVI